MVDARIRNTDAALDAAIVALAAVTPISRITVADVTRAAGINRATFYSHHATPSALLARVLTADLDEIRRADEQERMRSERPGPHITRDSLIETVRHVDRFGEVYRMALSDPRDGTTHHVLVEHLALSCRQHIDQSVDPAAVPGAPDLVAAFVAHGLVGTIETALARDTWDEDELARVLIAMFPVWWN